MWLAFQQGRCALLTGRVETARRWLGEALARCEESQIHGASRLVLSALGTAQAILGEVSAAASTALELDRLEPFAFTRPEQEFGRAWALVAAGDLPAARQVLRAAAEAAADTGYVSSEAWLLHDVVRLGDPGAVVVRLGELAAQSEGVLVAAYAAHASTAVNRDAKALVEVADRFEQMGTILLAAEVANEAAQAFQAEGDRRLSAALRIRAATLAESCEGAVTPGLASPVMVVPLTPRREISPYSPRVGVQQGDRGSPVPLDPHRQQPPAERVLEAWRLGRHQLASALADLSIFNQ
jgi:hypothetical protein